MDEVEEVKRSLRNPIEIERLKKIASSKKNILIILSDYTRAAPNDRMIPPLLEELESAGCKAENITALVANGLHKPLPRSELEEFYGEVSNLVELVNHDAEDDEQLVYLGRTSFGTKLWVNKLVVDYDLVIATGLIEPHLFAGYSGGRKSILPGVAGRESICQNHGFKMISHPKARSSIIEGNPIHEDMVEAAKTAGLDYILNVIVSRNGRVSRAVAGDPYKAHIAGVKLLEGKVKVKVPSGADIIITSNGGYPLDRDLYQAVKGISTGEAIVKRGGVIIILSECIDGIGRGHEEFYKLMAESESPEEVLERIKRNEPIKDQWEAHILARTLKVANVVVVTKNIKHSLLEDMHLIPASSVEEALDISFRLVGAESKITAIPDGPYVVPYC